VFLNEEQKIKKNIINNDFAKQKIDDRLLTKWQGLINTLIDLFGISSALIMKKNNTLTEVLIKSKNQETPHEVNDIDFIGQALYCEKIISDNKALYIKNTLEDKNLKDNSDLDLNIISYYGLPLNWPDKKTFGTICILDNKSLDLNQNQKKLLKEFRNVIEDDLRQLKIQEKLSLKHDKISAQKDKLKRIIDSIDAGTWEWNIQTGEIICNKK